MVSVVPSGPRSACVVHQRLVHGRVERLARPRRSAPRRTCPGSPSSFSAIAANGPTCSSPCWRARWMSSSTGSSDSITPATDQLALHLAVAVDPLLVVHVLGLKPLQVRQPFGRQERVGVEVVGRARRPLGRGPPGPDDGRRACARGGVHAVRRRGPFAGWLGLGLVGLVGIVLVGVASAVRRVPGRGRRPRRRRTRRRPRPWPDGCRRSASSCRWLRPVTPGACGAPRSTGSIRRLSRMTGPTGSPDSSAEPAGRRASPKAVGSTHFLSSSSTTSASTTSSSPAEPVAPEPPGRSGRVACVACPGALLRAGLFALLGGLRSGVHRGTHLLGDLVQVGDLGVQVLRGGRVVAGLGKGGLEVAQRLVDRRRGRPRAACRRSP